VTQWQSGEFDDADEGNFEGYPLKSSILKVDNGVRMVLVESILVTYQLKLQSALTVYTEAYGGNTSSERC